MSGQRVELPAADGGSRVLGGYLVLPEGEGPWPGVVVVHELFGLDAEARGNAERMAAMGYATLAVDLYSDGGAKKCLVRSLRSMMSGTGPAYADIAAARSWLREQSSCTGKVGVVGFCMGGGFALMTLPDWDAAAVNYGQLPKDLDAAVQGSCPVVGSYGRRDLSLVGASEKLATALEKAGVPYDVKEYPNAGHAFLNEHKNAPLLVRPFSSVVMRAGPEPRSAADAWNRIDAFLTTHLR
ncbi:MAG: dienelactone hydrolase family protein [Nocardioidaceae bacterium]|nr:dienelactone hydrolase family protein [Nocardioidaceae bacterium]